MGGIATGGQRINRENVQGLVDSFLFSTGLTNHTYHITGSYRRGKPDCGDIELVFVTENPAEIKHKIMPIFGLNKDGGIKMQGLFGSVQFDIFVSGSRGLGAMLLHSTGCGLFNIKMRTAARTRGLKLNQYGLWRICDDSPVVLSPNEEDYFSYLGMDYKQPHERNN